MKDLFTCREQPGLECKLTRLPGPCARNGNNNTKMYLEKGSFYNNINYAGHLPEIVDNCLSLPPKCRL